MTYPYVLNKAIKTGTRLDFSKSLLIVDEAHNLESSVGFAQSINTAGIERAGKEFLSKCLPWVGDDFDETNIQNLGTALSRLSQVVGKFSLARSYMQDLESGLFSFQDGEKDEESEHQKAKRQDKQAFLSRLENELKEDYEVICEASEKVEFAKREVAKQRKHETLRNPFFSITNFVDTLTENFDEYELFSEGDGILSIKLVDPAPSLQILKEPEILVMMSGTMPSSDYVEKVWDIGGCAEISVLREYTHEYDSVFKRSNLDLEVMQDPQVTTGWSYRKRSGEQLWQRYAEVISKAFEKESDLSVLVCCPSYPIARRISNHIQSPKFVEDKQTPIEEVKKTDSRRG